VGLSRRTNPTPGLPGCRRAERSQAPDRPVTKRTQSPRWPRPRPDESSCLAVHPTAAKASRRADRTQLPLWLPPATDRTQSPERPPSVTNRTQFRPGDRPGEGRAKRTQDAESGDGTNPIFGEWAVRASTKRTQWSGSGCLGPASCGWQAGEWGRFCRPNPTRSTRRPRPEGRPQPTLAPGSTPRRLRRRVPSGSLTCRRCRPSPSRRNPSIPARARSPARRTQRWRRPR
jgi:hypothetical protein